MPQAISAVDICNLALDRLGHHPLSSIDAPQDAMEFVMARWYDSTRREMLRKYIFNFARKSVRLTTSANAPAHPEFTNGYALPNDFIRLLTIGDRILYGGAIPTQFFDFNQGFLYCDDLTDQGTGVAVPAPVLGISAIYRSGDTLAGVVVPAGSTVIVPSGSTPIPGAVYTLGSVGGAVQANGNQYQIVAGTLGNAGAVYFLQTAGGQNFDSAAWSAYTSGGTATPTYVPPGTPQASTGLQVNYVYDVKLVQSFDPLFVKVLWLQLAVNICKKITTKEPSERLLAELLDANMAAAAVAGQEKPPRRVQRSRIRDVRRSGGIFRNNTVIGGWGP